MRKLLSKKAGAFFNSETQHITFVVKKENIEIVGKIRSGLYVVLYLVRTGNDRGDAVCQLGALLRVDDWRKGTAGDDKQMLSEVLGRGCL